MVADEDRIGQLMADMYESISGPDVTPFLAEADFYEVETARTIRVFGNMGHVWSVYEARRAPADPVAERRGINSIQVYRDHTGRWWVLSMVWDNERPGLTVAAPD